ncbi:NADP-dependent 3-hydroxy acid dehydrogenase [Yarrowia sp. C11]|nr:NADP-dependent 3-hydroxy acid dehydrogenase [Yarrowia sp. C11]
MSFGDKAAARLAGKTVFVTGASSGIGQATVLALAEAAKGDLKFVLAARRTDRLEELKTKLESDYKGIQVLPFKLDVSKVEETENIVSKLPKEFAEVDVLINNAGMVHGTEKIGSINQSDIEIMFHTNVLGLISVTQQFVNEMRKRNKGDIVNIGSIAGREPYVGGGIYCATKAAVRSFTESLRKENIDTRIRVIEVDPGAVETEFSVVRFRGDKDKADAVYAGTEPLVADDIAEFITYTLTRRENVVIADTLIFPNHQASPTHMFRKN